MKDIQEYINEKQNLPTVYLSLADAEDVVKFIKDHKLEKEAEKFDFYHRLREAIV